MVNCVISMDHVGLVTIYKVLVSPIAEVGMPHILRKVICPATDSRPVCNKEHEFGWHFLDWD